MLPLRRPATGAFIPTTARIGVTGKRVAVPSMLSAPSPRKSIRPLSFAELSGSGSRVASSIASASSRYTTRARSVPTGVPW